MGAAVKAIIQSTGELIAFLDCDDCGKNYLSSRSEYFSDDDIDYFYINLTFISRKNKKKKFIKNTNYLMEKIFDALAKDYFIIISGVIFKRFSHI